MPTKPASEVRAAPFDFRRPTKLGREQVRALEELHEGFTRRFGATLSQQVRSVVRFKPLSVEQVTYDDYIRSLPSPTLLADVSFSPLPGTALVELSVHPGLAFVDRLMGGSGDPEPVNRPTELEQSLLRDIIEYAADSLAETFEPHVVVTHDVGAVEYNPNVVQAASASEPVLVLSWIVEQQAPVATEGILSVCYPYPLLQPLLERLSRADRGGSDADGPAPAESLLPHAGVELTVHLEPTRMAARDIASLQPGDVVVLDHEADAPAIGTVGDQAVLELRVGRHGRRSAVQIVGWHTTEEPDAPQVAPATDDAEN